MSRYSGVELLNADHETEDFDCGSPAQTKWLRKHALTAQGSGTSRVYVVCESGTRRVVGYYALAAASISQAAAAEGVAKGLPRYPIPAILLTRLGVDSAEQNRGLGKALVVDAIQQALRAADAIGVRALLIHAEDERAREFYLHLADFEESPSDPLHLMLRIDVLKATVSAPDD